MKKQTLLMLPHPTLNSLVILEHYDNLQLARVLNTGDNLVYTVQIEQSCSGLPGTFCTNGKLKLCNLQEEFDAKFSVTENHEMYLRQLLNKWTEQIDSLETAAEILLLVQRINFLSKVLDCKDEFICSYRLVYKELDGTLNRQLPFGEWETCSREYYAQVVDSITNHGKAYQAKCKRAYAQYSVGCDIFEEA